MAYIGNIIDSTKVAFDEIKATSSPALNIRTVSLGGGEAGVDSSPVDDFGISLEKVILDCNTPDFDIIDMGTVSTIGIVDFGYI
mgnify:CR=1 FL=1